MFVSGCCGPKVNTTVLKPFISILKHRIPMENINKYICNSMSAGQPVSTSKVAITGLVSLPNLTISYNGKTPLERPTCSCEV